MFSATKNGMRRFSCGLCIRFEVRSWAYPGLEKAECCCLLQPQQPKKACGATVRFARVGFNKSYDSRFQPTRLFVNGRERPIRRNPVKATITCSSIEDRTGSHKRKCKANVRFDAWMLPWSVAINARAPTSFLVNDPTSVLEQKIENVH